MWARCGQVYLNGVDMCINFLKELAVSRNVVCCVITLYKTSNTGQKHCSTERYHMGAIMNNLELTVDYTL